MSTFLALIAHILIIIGAILMAHFTLRLIFDAPSTAERNIRILALMTGFLTFIGSKVVGLDVPTFLFGATQITKPLLARSLDVMLPGGAGTLTAWILLRGLANRDDENYPFRLMIVLATFILALFGDVYTASFGIARHERERLLPNLSFTVALCFYVIIRHRTGETEAPQTREDWRNKL